MPGLDQLIGFAAAWFGFGCVALLAAYLHEHDPRR